VAAVEEIEEVVAAEEEIKKSYELRVISYGPHH